MRCGHHPTVGATDRPRGRLDMASHLTTSKLHINRREPVKAEHDSAKTRIVFHGWGLLIAVRSHRAHREAPGPHSGPATSPLHASSRRPDSRLGAKMAEFVYGISPNGIELFVGERSDVEWIARLRNAVSSSSTWGEFRRIMTPRGYRRLIEDRFDGDVEAARGLLARIAELLHEKGFDAAVVQADPTVVELVPEALRTEVGELLLDSFAPSVLGHGVPRAEWGRLTLTGSSAYTDEMCQRLREFAERDDASLILAHWIGLYDYGDGTERIGDDDPFDGGIPGYEDGDYPSYSLLAEQSLPPDILHKYGAEPPYGSGRLIDFCAGDAEDLCRDLQARGHSCVRDDELIQRARGAVGK